MDNLMESLLEAYLFENNLLLERLDEILLNAEKTGDLSDDEVNEVFRSMHTIKGSSAMMEFTPLTELSHHVEDLFFEIRDGGMAPLDEELKNELFNLLFKSTDRLREDLEKVAQSETLNMDIDLFITEIDELLKKIKTKYGKIQAQEVQAKEPVEQPVVEAIEEPEVEIVEVLEENKDLPQLDRAYFVQIYFDENCGMENLRAFIVLTALKDAGLDFDFYPEDVEENSDTAEMISKTGFFIGVSLEEDVESALSLINGLTNIKSADVIMNPNFGDEEEIVVKEEIEVPKEELVLEKDVQVVEAKEAEAKEAEAKEVKVTEKPSNDKNSKPEAVKKDDSAKQYPPKQAKQNLINVNLSKLDKLMAIVGEIVIAESMVMASPELQNLKLDNFLKSTRQLRKLTSDLQDIAMSLRMVPVSGVFQKMNRIVRDMAKTLNKDVRLTIIGEDTEVDKTIVDGIADPIMHIVRNAMDHGIEADVKERIIAGKAAQGEIILAAQHTGSEVVITIENDGKDLDPDLLLAKAEKKGILTKPPEEYKRKEILSLIMVPGFSTNAQVTEYSGRGVGMDVVRKNVEAIGGTVTISSDPGKGCCFTLKIPLTLAIVEGMEILVGDQVFTIPIASIKKAFKVTKEEIVYDTMGNEMISSMGLFYPVIRLNKLFKIPNSCDDIEDGIIILVDSVEKSYCLFVDTLVGEHQVVVKPLPVYLNNFNIKKYGISGCTIQGNGTISLILDIGNVYVAANEEIENLR